jgi:hypothetical protein
MTESTQKTIYFIGDIVEENGKTIRENNMERKHNIPIDTLVEVRYDNWFDDGACEKVHARLWVVEQGRDCDGTPLYSLCEEKSDVIPELQQYFGKFAVKIRHGFSEESLTVVEVTDKLKQGYDALKWEDELSWEDE